MRLKKLQIAGFKSFVDPTDITLPAQLVGIVGPNGCGKSNIIDAVRWVMGESSAKTLRGENMEDVIFNGSASRQPVGQASVELIFDNSEGRAGGNYARFAEISVQRTLTRDGQSTYLLNRIKSRRRDVLDLFRGTGLGARSYSIIEQGMVSRLIEARPEDLRLFVEEAADISRYKDRRRETETRIRQTRENLERVADILSELERQLRRLKQQSGEARRYKRLKVEHRSSDGRLQLLRLDQHERQLAEQSRLAADCENAFQSAMAAQRHSEAELEKQRQSQAQAQQESSRVQQELYRISGEISRTEQRIEHVAETRQQQTRQLDQLKLSLDEWQQQRHADHRKRQQLQHQQSELQPQLDALVEQRTAIDRQLTAAESNLHQRQTEWEAFNQQAQQSAQQKEVQKTRLEQVRLHLHRAQVRKQKIESEQQTAQASLAQSNLDALRAEVTGHDRRCADQASAVSRSEQQLDQLRQQQQRQQQEIAACAAALQEANSRLQSLEQIQTAALGEDNPERRRWLQDNGLADLPQLTPRIQVADGWQSAADRVLAVFFNALCLPPGTPQLPPLPAEFGLTLISPGRWVHQPGDPRLRLSDKVKADGLELGAVLADVFIAESVPQALAMQPGLCDRQCVVTRDGTLVGANWISFAGRSRSQTGVLVRATEIKKLRQQAEERQKNAAQLAQQAEQIEADQRRQEDDYRQQRARLEQLQVEKTELHGRLGRQEARSSELQQRLSELAAELGPLSAQIDADSTDIAQTQQQLESAAEQGDSLQAERSKLAEQRQQAEQNLRQIRAQQHQVQAVWHELSLQQQRLESARESLTDSLQRVQQHISGAEQQSEATRRILAESTDPPAAFQDSLAAALAQRQEIETRLSASRDAIAEVENRIAELTRQHSEYRNRVDQARSAMEQRRLSQQETQLRHSTLLEQFDRQQHDREQLRAELPPDASIEQCEHEVQRLDDKIGRIGSVNLVAIEEFEEQSERKHYLEQQSADLNEALATLQSVMSKIDQQTRARFKQTFNQINDGFQQFFPQLFGGGKAELQLIGGDLLNAGVGVMARPPGKRNSTIQLLSGGEKALTAVALLFALFRLHPAPFCLLDEVDAPLDDANVERYCQTLRRLTDISQIIVVTHNKITMTAADVLIGVTMAESGVSRLVSVDLDRALQLAAQ